MSNVASKPWPRDCIPLFCEPSETACIPHMDDINFGVCSDCGRAISYDSKTIAEAEETGYLTGHRPVRLFCTRCLPQYNFQEVDLFIDYSGGTGVREYVPRSQPATMTQYEALREVMRELGVDTRNWNQRQYRGYLYSLGRMGGKSEQGRRLILAIEAKTGHPFQPPTATEMDP